jgi:glutamyl-tRNA reductase
MKLLLTGLNHRTAPVEVRERIAFDERTLPEALDNLKRCPAAVAGFLADSRQVDRSWVTPYLYHHNGPDAVRHLFRVASSLDSMVVGEPQILGQLKSAYSVAKENGSLSGFLDLVMTHAFKTAKRVRSETDIGSSAVSVSYAAVELAREIFSSLKGKRVLVIGAGKMAESAARHLQRAGVSEILVTNRTRERAANLADACGGRVIDYDKFEQILPTIDIVLASSGATKYILTKDQIRAAKAKRRDQFMFFIDIAVPRNIDPAVNEIEGVFVYDIDDLGAAVDKNVRGRMDVAKDAEIIIGEEVERMMARLKTREIAPTIVSLQEQLELWRKDKIERHRAKLGSLTPQQEEAIDAITRGLVNEIAHGPISELRKQASEPTAPQALSMIRRLFRLGGD